MSDTSAGRRRTATTTEGRAWPWRAGSVAAGLLVLAGVGWMGLWFVRPPAARDVKERRDGLRARDMRGHVGDREDESGHRSGASSVSKRLSLRGDGSRQNAQLPPSTLRSSRADTVATQATPTDPLLARFDRNARAFDERRALFEQEWRAGSRAEEAEQTLLAEVERECSELKVNLQAEFLVQCTESICEVQIFSDQPVGTLLAHAAPWLASRPDRAVGEKTPDGEQEGFLVMFDRRSEAEESSAEDLDAAEQ